jgi:hypothetical protein
VPFCGILYGGQLPGIIPGMRRLLVINSICRNK